MQLLSSNVCVLLLNVNFNDGSLRLGLSKNGHKKFRLDYNEVLKKKDKRELQLLKRQSQKSERSRTQISSSRK
jgi:hypothetical protein